MIRRGPGHRLTACLPHRRQAAPDNPPDVVDTRSTATHRPPAQAKFLPPRPRHPLPRARLHALLDDAASARGVWLQAQAGAGKSTLAATWAAHSGRPLAWYRVDATDADLASSCASLAALLATLSRRRLPAALLRPPPPLADEAALQAHARHFFRAFHAHAGALVLVVDDAHAAPTPALAALLHAAIDEAPADSVVLVTSRQPPHGLLLEAAARGDLALVDGQALAFTTDEAVALLAPRLAADQARALHARTGGWAAGLTLLAASPGGPTSADMAERTVADFFAQRVLGLLDDAQRRLLGQVSLLPEVDEPALAQLGLGPAAGDALDQLCQQLGFVQRLRRGQRCWRLHDLLTQALQSAWPTLGDAVWRQQALLAAASVQATQGRLQPAVELLCRADAAGAALALWQDQAANLLRQGRALELQRAFNSLQAALPANPVRPDAATGPAAGETRHPATDHALAGRSITINATALTQRGIAAWMTQDADTGDWFDRAWAALDAVPSAAADSPQRLLAAAAALNAQFTGWRSYAGRADWLQRFLAAWPARARLADADAGLRADKAAILCFLTHRMAPLPEPERDALLARVLTALARPDPALDPNVVVTAASSLVEWCNYTNDRALLAKLADLSPPWLALPGLAGAAQASWWIGYGWVSVRLVMGRSDLPEGEAAVEHGVSLAQACGAPDIAFYGLANLVAAAASRQQLALAEQRLQQLQQVAAERSGSAQQPTQQATIHVLAARLLTMRGDATTALVRIHRALEVARQSDFPASETWIHHLGHVQVLTALGREEEAEAIANTQSEAYDGLRRDHLLALAALARLARAWRTGVAIKPANSAADAGADIAADVAACIGLAARHDWLAVGNHLPGTAAQLAAAALSQGVQPDFVRRLVRQRRLPAPQPDLADWPWPLRVRALGGFEVLVDEQPLDFGARPQKKPLDLLRLLVARGPAPLATAAVIDALWPDADGDRAKASLDMAVLRLRKLLGEDEALRLDSGHLSLNRAWVWVDAWAWAASADLPYAGPLFGAAPPELAWAAQREALHGQYLRRCQAQGQQLERQGQWAEALAVYQAALAQDALEEALHRGAIRCHLALGEPAAAQRAFARCRDQLQAGLGVRPASATLALVAGL